DIVSGTVKLFRPSWSSCPSWCNIVPRSFRKIDTRFAMTQIKFGVGIYGTDNAREAVALARSAEELGYDRFWIGDSHMIWRELYVLAGAIAVATNRIAI